MIRATLIIALFSAIAFVGWDLSAFAADPHHGDDHGSGGLPQMDIKWFPTQIFWLLVTFGILYTVVSKRVLPELSTIIEDRRNHIQGDLDTAQQLKEEAESVQNAYEDILDDARQKSSEAFSKMHDDLKTKVEAQQTAFQNKSTQESEEFEKRLSTAKTAALKDMDVIAAEIAAQAAEKIVGISTDLNNAKTVVKSVNQQSKKKAA